MVQTLDGIDENAKMTDAEKRIYFVTGQMVAVAVRGRYKYIPTLQVVPRDGYPRQPMLLRGYHANSMLAV
jgi:hypothetical protein